MADREGGNDTRRLLILDMNGLLCHKIYKKDLEKMEPVLDQYERLDLKHCYVFIRPDIHDFLEKCFDLAEVAFWTSTTYPNAKPILDHLLSKSQQNKTVFRWYRDRTRLDPSYQIDTGTKPTDTIKNIDDVFSSPVINYARTLNNHNTILCDDDREKIRFNDDRNTVIAPMFNPWISDDHGVIMDCLFDRIVEKFRSLTDHD